MNTALRRSGISVPLFSLRSTRGWGIGEIGDIPYIAAWLRSAGQSVLQILPLNELGPTESSPYSALSAMAIDPQFISLWMMDDAETQVDQPTEELERLRQSPTIDYRAVRDLKNRALARAFERFVTHEWRHGTARADALRAFIATESWWLDDYSLYRALRLHHGERPWPEWPVELRDRHAEALSAAAAALFQERLYVQYLQWIAAGQWQAVRRQAEGIELLGDFPFMVTLDSADVWSRPEDFLLDSSVGTPPDAFSDTGQEWGLPPYNWMRARDNGFEWLRMRARRQAALYDGYRVDHLVGFYRTYVRPLDRRPPYFMPAVEHEQTALGEAVMRILIDTGADISVEDLGTVPDFVRESIARIGLPGYKVLRWESALPALYPALSVAMTGTHDTEPLAIWWEVTTPAERRHVGIESDLFNSAVRDTIVEAMLHAGSDLVILPIQDVFGWRDRINQPATVGDMNWTFALPWPVDTMAEQDEARECAKRLQAWSAAARRQPPPFDD